AGFPAPFLIQLETGLEGQADARNGKGLVDVGRGSAGVRGVGHADAGEGQHAGSELIGQTKLIVFQLTSTRSVASGAVITPGTFDADTDRTRSGTVGQVADTSGPSFTITDIGDVFV